LRLQRKSCIRYMGIIALAVQHHNCQSSIFSFSNREQEYRDVIHAIGLPFVIKPVIRSSGKGQSIINEHNEIKKSWDYAQNGARGHAKVIMVEHFIDIDYEITLLTVRHKDDTSFCDPI
ncbi:ATP-grasp domain-containing protein, partial [Francisella tularensis]|nr:ATP-grasp domain-containing protein [Francisella tularensis]